MTQPNIASSSITDPRVLALAKGRHAVAQADGCMPPWDGLDAAEQRTFLTVAAVWLQAGEAAGLVPPAVGNSVVDDAQCSFPPCESGSELCATHERLRAHEDGEHAFCGDDCGGTVAHVVADDSGDPVHVDDCPGCEADGFRARRGDVFDRWLKLQRDDPDTDPETSQIVGDLLNRWRLHADTGTPLDRRARECLTGDCDCGEPPNGVRGSASGTVAYRPLLEPARPAAPDAAGPALTVSTFTEE